MKVREVRCDVCGKAKKDDDVWFLVEDLEGLGVTIWDEDYDDDPNRLDICGPECVSVVVEKWTRKQLEERTTCADSSVTASGGSSDVGTPG